MSRRCSTYPTGMDRLCVLSGTPRHRILTGRIRARTRDRQMVLFRKNRKGRRGYHARLTRGYTDGRAHIRARS